VSYARIKTIYSIKYVDKAQVVGDFEYYTLDFMKMGSSLIYQIKHQNSPSQSHFFLLKQMRLE